MAAAKKKKGTVGIVGLGIMGGSFARNLAASGWRVIGFDISQKARGAAKRAGVELADSPAEVARQAPVVITSLPKPAALKAVAQEIAAAKLPRKIIVECSTFEIEDKEAAEGILRQAGHTMLDVPVSGTGAQARTKDLIFYASGDTAAIGKVKRMFRDFGREIYDLGAFGNGSKMKYVANLLVAIHNVASAEAMTLGMKAGLDPNDILKVIQPGAGNSRIFELRAPMMVKNSYDDATMKISVWQKDMQVIGDYAKKIGVTTPTFTASNPVYEKAMKAGFGDLDTAAVCAVLEKMAHVKRGKLKRDGKRT